MHKENIYWLYWLVNSFFLFYQLSNKVLQPHVQIIRYDRESAQLRYEFKVLLNTKLLYSKIPNLFKS